MDKNEFLETLRESLMGEIKSSEIESNIKYYNDYITQSLAIGKSNEEILSELGDPRLIAKTIIESAEHSKNTSYNDYDSLNNSYSSDNSNSSNSSNSSGKISKIVILVLSIIVLFIIVGIVMKLFFKIALPIIVIGIAIIMITKIVKK